MSNLLQQIHNQFSLNDFHWNYTFVNNTFLILFYLLSCQFSFFCSVLKPSARRNLVWNPWVIVVQVFNQRSINDSFIKRSFIKSIRLRKLSACGSWRVSWKQCAEFTLRRPFLPLCYNILAIELSHNRRVWFYIFYLIASSRWIEK